MIAGGCIAPRVAIQFGRRLLAFGCIARCDDQVPRLLGRAQQGFAAGKAQAGGRNERGASFAAGSRIWNLLPVAEV